MNLWLIAALVIGMLAIAGVAIVANTQTAQAEQLVEEPKQPSCGQTCGGSCSANSNCGQATCGAVTGKGGCGCK